MKNVSEATLEELSAVFERAVEEAYLKGFDQGLAINKSPLDKPKAGTAQRAYVRKTPNQQRYETIQRARKFVGYWESRAQNQSKEEGNSELMDRGSLDIQFIVNAEKRTVVCIARSIYYKTISNKGIAKCNPSDVFNADIGKAIALARALEIEIPAEFLRAVQPSEVVVGMVTIGKNFGDKYPVVRFCDFEISISDCGRPFRFTENDIDGWVGTNQVVIIDDSNAEYSHE